MKKIIIALIFCAQALFAQEIYATFDVEASKSAMLSLDATGSIKSINVDIGSKVKKGDILLELNNAEERLSLELAKIALKKATLAFEHAKNSFERYASLKEVIDKEQYDRYEFDKNLKEQDFYNAQRSLELAGVRFDKTLLKAPFDGVISAKLVEVGDSISGMQLTPTLEIVDLDEVKLILSFDEKYWTKVNIGTPFNYKVDGDESVHAAKVSKLYPTVDPKTRRMKAEVVAKNMAPGLFGDGYLVVGE